MTTKSYYSVVRYVPDDLKDEAINIGVLLVSGTNECSAHFSENLSRVAHLDPSIDRSTIEAIVSATKERLVEQAEKYPLAEIVARYSGGKIQLTRPRLTLADNSHTELAYLQAQFLTPEPHRDPVGFTEHRLIKDVRDVLYQQLPSLPDNVVKFAGRRKPLVYEGRRARHGFDVSFTSPQKTDLIRCITFDVKDYAQKVNAAKILTWDFDDIKSTEHGAIIDIISVLYPPSDNKNGHLLAFQEAEHILDEKGIGTYNFAREVDRKGLATLAQKRVLEATA